MELREGVCVGEWERKVINNRETGRDMLEWKRDALHYTHMLFL